MKTIAIISYWVSPIQCAGANRINAFINYLTKSGWRVVLIRPDYKGKFSVNHRQFNFDKTDVVNADKVYRLTAIDPVVLIKKIFRMGGRVSEIDVDKKKNLKGYFAKLINSIVAKISFPDNYYFLFALLNKRKVLNICRNEKIDVLLTSAMPMSINYLGAYVKQHYKCTWVADFRDLYIDNPNEEQGLYTKKINFQTKILRQADLCITVSDGLAKKLLSQIDATQKISVVYNGYEQDFYNIAKADKLRKENYQGLFLGTLYTNQYKSFKLFLNLIETAPFLRKSLFKIIGNNKLSVLENLSRSCCPETILKKISLQSTVGFNEIESLYKEADFLIQFDFEQDGNLSSKIFEYLSTGLPVMLFTLNKNSELSRLVASAGGIVIDGKNETLDLDEQYFDYDANYDFIKCFSRATQTYNLSAKINSITLPAKQKKITIIHIINSLGVGGAETSLCKLLENQPENNTQTYKVFYLYRLDANLMRVKSLGIEVFYIGDLTWYQRKKIIDKIEPDIIHSWLYESCVVGYLLRLISKNNPKLIWSIRNSLHLYGKYSIKRRLQLRMMALFSNKANLNLFNSNISRSQHLSLGFTNNNKVVFNGYYLPVTTTLDFNEIDILRRYNIDYTKKIALTIARNHPEKGYKYLIDAIETLFIKDSDITFVLLGRDLNTLHEELPLNNIIHKYKDRLITVTEQNSVVPFLKAANVLICPSLTESFPNSIGEAMSYGVPIIATNVGDSAFLVGDSGFMIEPADSESLALAINKFFNLSSKQQLFLGAKARENIVTKFSLARFINENNDVYNKVLNRNVISESLI